MSLGLDAYEFKRRKPHKEEKHSRFGDYGFGNSRDREKS